MFKNVTQAYDLTDATWEILIMLVIAFLLGMLFHYLFFRNPESAVSSGEPDNLKVVEGVGPKIEELLNNAGIHNFADLSRANPNQLKRILDAAGPKFKMHDPKTWPKQAGMAMRGEMKELEKYQNFLNKGKDHA